MARISADNYFLQLAHLVAKRGTCGRRQVGAVLINKHKHIIATGYNGRPRGFVECSELPCSAVGAASGTDLGGCEAVHAEQNALLQCGDVEQITTIYTTTSPCIHCLKMLLNTSCQRIVFSDLYRGSSQSQSLWESSGRIWEQHFLP